MRPTRRFCSAAVLSVVFLSFAVPSIYAQSTIKTVSLTFTTIDVPAAVQTSVQAINKNGDMVGWYAYSSSGPYHAFLLRAGVFTFFDHPGAVSTIANSINDAGLIAGLDGDVDSSGFLYDGTTFTDIRAGNRTRTDLYGINNAGIIVGSAGTPSAAQAVELRGGKSKLLNFPGSYVYGFGTGINNHGVAVGFTTDGFYADAYLYKSGQVSSLDIYGATQTQAWGVNDNSIIVGAYENGPPFAFHAFALKSGKFLSFDYPGAETFAQGVNALGQVVGWYTFDFQTYHGFVTNPITDASFR